MLTLNRIEMTLGEFIQQEMARRKIRSNREFARKAGVSPQLINDLVNRADRELDIGSLIKLSDFTGASIMTLFKLAFPEVVNVDIDIEYLLDAEKIRKLPPEKRAIARGYINTAYAESKDE